MNKLVQFTMINNTKPIEDRLNYIKDVVNDLKTNHFISEFIANSKLREDRETDQEIKMLLDADEGYYITYKIIEEGGQKEYSFNIEFQFSTYSTTQQLYLDIQSDDYSIEISHQVSYLSNLKCHLKDILMKKSSWEKCIWLYDKESEEFAIDLYPKIYRTENLFRRLINEVMNKSFGVIWWDRFIPIKLKDKRARRLKSYKAAAPSFCNVDEALMTIDVGDLLKIIQLKDKIWKPEHNANIEEMLMERQAPNLEKILNELKAQMELKNDLWKDNFSKYFPKDFIEEYKKFESNRNHVAHNKLIDFKAYTDINKSTEIIENCMNQALEQVRNDIISEEQKIQIKEWEAEEVELRESAYKQLKETEANVEIRNTKEIFNLYEENIINLHSEIEEAFRFRDDIVISQFDSIKHQLEPQSLFDIKSSVLEREIEIECIFDIETEQGGTSKLKLIAISEESELSLIINYINARVYYNDEQGCYIPEIQDEFSTSDLQQALDSLIDFINESLPNMREIVDGDMYGIIKDGGDSPVANGIYCGHCKEEYICVDEEYGEFGQCLNCGEMNDIVYCEYCSSYVEGEGGDETEILICDTCWENKIKD